MTGRVPNLFLVGAPKCGTTSMAYYLGQHPDIFVPLLKEPMYFGSDLLSKAPRLTEEEYFMLYRDWSDERYALDGSTAYLASEAAPGEISGRAPDAKILIIVRNPIDAAYSLYWQNRADLAEDSPTFEESLDAEEERWNSRRIPRVGSLNRRIYSKIFAFTHNINNFRAVFPHENIKIIVFDDMKKEPVTCLLDTFEFLGISRKGSYSFDLRNPASQPRSNSFARFLSDPPKLMKSTVRAMLPFRFRVVLRQAIGRLNQREVPYPPMKPETRKVLTAKFAPEVERLSNFLGRDLSHWLEK